MAEQFHTERTKGAGKDMNDFMGGKQRYRKGLIGRFGGGEASGKGMLGTFYRAGMPSPIQGGSPAMSTFVKGKSTGVNFFSYGQSVKGTGPGKTGTRNKLATAGDVSGQNDSYGGGSVKITGFTTNISRGYSPTSDYGGTPDQVFAIANESYYKQNFDQTGSYRYGDYTKGFQGISSNNALDSSAGGVSEGRQSRSY
tara:strand:- start:997 stop:1587 length:591 start_codon:yes stop_codon:yes gene_type:complete